MRFPLARSAPFLLTIFCFIFVSSTLVAALQPLPSLAIVGIGRDCQRNLPKALAFIDQVCAYFPESRVFLYENDSADSTPALIHTWALGRPHIKTESEKRAAGGYPEFIGLNRQINRFDRITRARNRYMVELEKQRYDHCRFVMVLDLDLIEYPAVEEVCRCFEKNDWDSVSSNGRNAQTGIYYDTFAFRNKEIPIGPEIAGPNWWAYLQPIQRLFRPGSPVWIPIDSGFGGMALYRMNAIRGERYACEMSQEMLEEVRLIVSTNQKAQRLLMRCLGSLEVIRQKPFPARGEPAEVGTICEHVPLHFQMKKKGFGRFFLNRKLISEWRK